MAGRLLLNAEIASKSIYTRRERKRIRAFETLRAKITTEFDARRRGDLILKGFTEASPAKPLTISPDLELKYDFARGTARSGDIRFDGVRACIKAEEPESVRGKDTQPPEYQRAEDRACKISAAGEPYSSIIELQLRTLSQCSSHRARKRYLQTVENPRDTQCNGDPCVKTSPRQAIEPCGYVDLNDAWGASHGDNGAAVRIARPGD